MAKARLPIHAVEDAATQRALRAAEEAINNGIGTPGADGAAGPAGPAPSGTGLVRVTGGAVDARAELSGDVSTAGALVTTIGANKVTMAMLIDIATASFLGRTTAGAGDPEVLTAAQATALLNVFTSALTGLVPASGGGVVNYLRADATFASPLTTNPGLGFPRMAGHDGSATMDGSATVAGASRSGSTYTLTRSAFYSSLTINSGVVLLTAGFKLHVSGTLTNNGAIRANGAAGSGTTGGAAGGAINYLQAGSAGGNGSAGTGNGANGATGGGSGLQAPVATATSASVGGSGGAGGAGDVPFRGGGGGAAGAGVGGNTGVYTLLAATTDVMDVFGLWKGRPNAASSTTNAWRAGWGGGGGAATGAGSAGGGGGGGAGVIWVDCTSLAGTGTIEATGGAGATGSGGTGAGGGGGGGGGLVIVFYGTRSGSITLPVTGGAAGAASGTGFAGGAGAAGYAFLFNTSGNAT